jgi:hypothetical protein
MVVGPDVREASGLWWQLVPGVGVRFPCVHQMGGGITHPPVRVQAVSSSGWENLEPSLYDWEGDEEQGRESEE